jgi:hypothetical protein
MITQTENIRVESLGLDPALTKRIKVSIINYRKGGIDVQIVREGPEVVIKQSRLINGYILNNKQLYERGKEIFEGTGLKPKIIPAVYSLDVDTIDHTWIENKMEEFGIHRNDLVKQLALDKSTLSLFLSGERKMNKSVKATFFYYFLVYEINRDVRESGLI